MAKKVDAEYYRQLEQIQAADFVLVELSLYLNTHPHDEDALKQFNQYSGYSAQKDSSNPLTDRFCSSATAPRQGLGLGKRAMAVASIRRNA